MPRPIEHQIGHALANFVSNDSAKPVFIGRRGQHPPTPLPVGIPVGFFLIEPENQSGDWLITAPHYHPIPIVVRWNSDTLEWVNGGYNGNALPQRTIHPPHIMNQKSTVPRGDNGTQ